MFHGLRFLVLVAAAALCPAAPAQQATCEFDLVPLWGTMTFSTTTSVGGGSSPAFVLTGELGLQFAMQPGPFPFASLGFNGGVIGTSVPTLQAQLHDWTQPGSPVVGTADLSNLTFTATSPMALVGPGPSYGYAGDLAQHIASITFLSGQFAVTMSGQSPLVLDLTGMTVPSVHLSGDILLVGSVIRLYTETGVGIHFNFPNGISGVFGIGGSFFAEYALIQSLCPGDGSGTHCPCGNDASAGAGSGCLNSNGVGARLEATGSPSLGADSLVLVGNDIPVGAATLFFQGTGPSSGGNGTVFGDGLRCASGNVLRLGTKLAAGGTASYPGTGDVRVSVKGMVQTAASTRFYQAWYRNAAAFCTPSTFNLTNALSVFWVY